MLVDLATGAQEAAVDLDVMHRRPPSASMWSRCGSSSPPTSFLDGGGVGDSSCCLGSTAMSCGRRFARDQQQWPSSHGRSERYPASNIRRPLIESVSCCTHMPASLAPSPLRYPACQPDLEGCTERADVLLSDPVRRRLHHSSRERVDVARRIIERSTCARLCGRMRARVRVGAWWTRE